MEELMAALKATESSFKNFESDFKQTKQRLEDSTDPYDRRKKPQSTGVIDFNSAKKVVQKSSPVVSFSKTQRFHTPTQDLNSSMESNSTVESNASLSAIKNKTPTVLFGKTKRFQEEKRVTNREFDLNPKYDYVKKRDTTAPVIKSPSMPDPKVRIAKKLQLAEKTKSAKSPLKHADPEESIETVRLEDQERETCGFSDILSDTTEILGPGAYNPNYRAIEVRKSVGFPKAARFKGLSEAGNSDGGELNPKYDYVKKGVAGVKIAKDTVKNEKLIKKKEEEARQAELSSQMRLKAPVENDKAVRSKIPGVVMKDVMDTLDEEERLQRIFNLLEKRREARRVAPGSYEPQDLDEPICTVVMRKSLSPKVMRLPERPPSPTRYYSKDDLIKTNQPAFSFKREGIDNTPKLEDFDMRKPLDVNLDLVKPRAPGAIVLPEHKHEEIPDLTDIRVGPGTYEPSHQLTEKRTDIGVVKFAELNENNNRENQMDLAKKDIYDADLEPDYNVVKPRAPGFVYYKPVELEGPTHVPDKLLNPGEWKFYDADINAIKPDVGDIQFAGGLSRDQFLEREQDHNQFLEYQARKDKKPEVGQYDVKYGGIEPEQKAPDFGRYLERDTEMPDKENMEVDGDILILNPEKPKPKLPNIKFEQQLGREEGKEKDEHTEELLLEPVYDLVRPRQINYVDFNKQGERKDLFDKKVDENSEELLLDVNYKQIDPRIKGVPDISKLTSREDHEHKKSEYEEELIIEPSHKQVKPDNTRTGISMDSKTKRFNEVQKEDLKDGRWTTEQAIDYQKTLDATKPERNVVDFDRYSVREPTKDTVNEKSLKKRLRELNMGIKKQELPIIEEEAFEKYPKEENQEQKKEPKTMIIKELKPVKLDKSVKRGTRGLKENAEPNEGQQSEAVGEKEGIEPWEDQ